MYTPTALLFLVASSASASMLAQRAAPIGIMARDVSQGWSLQASSAPGGTTSCGNGAYCPSSLSCNTAANHEVAACCSGSSDCRGSVEGSPKCADSSWNLWVGYDGNGFCCEAGLVGAYDTSKSVAGTCVSSVGSLRSAQLTSTGSGAAATSAASSSASAAASTTSSASSASSSASAASSASSASSSTSSAASAASSASSTSTGASSNATSTGSGATSTPSVTPNGAEKMGMGFGLIGAAFLLVAAL